MSVEAILSCFWFLDEGLTVCKNLEKCWLLMTNILEFDRCTRWRHCVDGATEATRLAIQLVVVEHMLGSEVAAASFAEVNDVLVFVEVEHESRKVLDPRIVAVPVEKIDGNRVLLLRDVERSALLPSMRENEDVDCDAELVFKFRNLARLNRV